MTNTQAVLKEIQRIRAAYAQTCKRLEQAQKATLDLTNQVKEMSEKTESLVMYTAMMTDTVPEVI